MVVNFARRYSGIERGSIVGARKPLRLVPPAVCVDRRLPVHTSGSLELLPRARIIRHGVGGDVVAGFSVQVAGVPVKDLEWTLVLELETRAWNGRTWRRVPAAIYRSVGIDALVVRLVGRLPVRTTRPVLLRREI